MAHEQPIYLSIVIPVYNEEENLPLLQERLRPVMDRLDFPAEVVYVDDGSSDGSYAVLRQLAHDDE